MSYATCRTAQCGNENIPIDVGDLHDPYADPGAPPSPVECGVCGKLITDISDSAPAQSTTEGKTT